MSLVFVIMGGAVIGLSIYIFMEDIVRISGGRCCEGCGTCPQKQACSGVPKSEDGRGGS